MVFSAQGETKYRAARILALSPTERAMQGLPLTLKDIAKLVGVNPGTIHTWKENLPQILDEMREQEEKRWVIERLEKDKKLRRIAERNLGPQDIAEVSEEEKLALARKVYEDAMKQGASASEKDVAVKMLGLMIDQKGVRRSGLTADEIARRNIEAERELSEWRSARGMAGQGVEEVPK